MKKNTIITIIALGVMISGNTLIASAQITNEPAPVNPPTVTSPKAKVEDLSKYKAKADQEIDRRIKALSELAIRVQAMKKVSETEKAMIASKIQEEQTALTTLRAKIDADTDKEVLKADVKSITISYRIFMLIMPQIQIFAAVDRIYTINASLGDIGTKLQARISELQGAGKDVTALQALMAEYNTKLADAKTQADAAVGYVSPLVPDQGDKTVQASNTEALKRARADIKVANQDFVAARATAKKIVEAIKAARDNTATTTPQR